MRSDFNLRTYLDPIKNFSMTQSLISISDLTRPQIEHILKTAAEFEKKRPTDLLKGKVLASCFFEPSTRTRLSFESAMYRLGGHVIGFADGNTTSAKKGESLSDSIRMIATCSDILVIRHPSEGSARLAAHVAEKPVINAGDGANQHPSQTLLDLYAIQACQGKIDGLQIAIGGDLKYGRTVHSLAIALSHFAVRLYFIASDGLDLPESITQELRKKGIKFSFHSHLEDVMPKIDIFYMTRIQKERFEWDSKNYLNQCKLKKNHLEKVKPHFRILHPMPRIDELEESIDATPYAFYFQQAALALPVRMALLSLYLGKI